MTRLYRGDVVHVALGPVLGKGIVRQVDGNRIKVQLSTGWTWLFSQELTWTGECLVRSPRTERGWRKAARVREAAL